MIKKRYIIAFIITLAVLALTNKFWLIFKAAHHAHFEFFVFTIILILSYLFGLKLTEYLVDFKEIKHQSRIEIIFLAIFFVMLFIPMSHIDTKSQISERENRTLAKYKPFITNGQINYTYGTDFNNWFNDRFNLRYAITNLRTYIMYLIANKCDNGYFDKKTKTTYPKWSFGHMDIDTIKSNFKALYDFNDWCNKHNIKLYILIVPQKADIHTTQLNYINDTNKHTVFLDYIKRINQENKIKIIYPYKEMLNAVKNGKQVYFKTEHHWTDDGTFIGYKELMKEIIKDYPNIKVLKNNDFNHTYNKMIRGEFPRDYNKGQDCWRLGLPDFICSSYHNYNYTYYKHKDFNNLKETIIDTKYHRGKIFKYNYGANYRVIQLGTSMNENLTEFIPFTFKNVKRIRNNNVKNIKAEEEFKIMKYYEEEILEYKPDIIIFCITYGNITSLHNLFNME